MQLITIATVNNNKILTLLLSHLLDCSSGAFSLLLNPTNTVTGFFFAFPYDHVNINFHVLITLTRAMCASNCLWSFLKFGTRLIVLNEWAGFLLFNCLSFRLFDSNFAIAPPLLTRVTAMGILLQQFTSNKLYFLNFTDLGWLDDLFIFHQHYKN